jgi:26S proteasome regulatory subunit N10
MQEEQARQLAEEQARQEASASAAPSVPATAPDPPPTSSDPTAPTDRTPEGSTTTVGTKDVEMGVDEDEEMDEEDAIAKAIQMSMKNEEEKKD